MPVTEKTQTDTRRDLLSAALDNIDDETGEELNANVDDVDDEGAEDQSAESEVEGDESESMEGGDESESGVDAEATSGGDALLNELAKKTEITLDDLRRLPGAADLDDAELEEMWAAAQAGAAPSPFKPEGFRVFSEDGKEIEDLAKMSAVDFLKHQIGYSVRGKEVKKAFKDLVRTAVNGHHNESRLQSVISQRDQSLAKARETAERLSKMDENEQLVVYAFQQYHMGNEQPLKTLLTSYQSAMGAAPRSQSSESQGSGGEGDAASQKVYYEYIRPKLSEMSKSTGVEFDRVDAEFMRLLEAEPAEFLTQERLDEMLEFDVPSAIEQLGGTRGPNPEVEAMKKQIAELTAQLKNGQTQRAREKQKKMPSGGKGRKAATGGDNIVPDDALASRGAMKKWLRE